MDFQIITDSNGIGQLTFTKNTDIRTDVWLSLMIKKGSWFVNPEFGCELFKIKKVTNSNLMLVKEYCLAALEWLIVTSRASSTDCTVVRDPRTYNRYAIDLTVTQANGIKLFYQLFSDVQTGKIQWAPVGGP